MQERIAASTEPLVSLARSSKSDEALLRQYAYLCHETERLRTAAGRVEQELFRRMEERGATSIPNDTFICEAVTKNEYNQEGFKPLLEIFSGADVDTCFIPAHPSQAIIPEKWITAKVKALARRYGDVALGIVEKARIPGPRHLTFHPRTNDVV